MASICSSQTPLTDTDLKTIYGTSTNPGILPAEPYQQADREPNGLLKETTLTQIVATLKSKGVIPILPQNPTENDTAVFTNKQKALLLTIHDEYCFYDSRYKYALEKLLTNIQKAYESGSTENKSVIDSYLEATQKLNQRLNDLSQVANAISEDMMKTNTRMHSEIAKFHKDISKKHQALKEHNKILSSQEATVKLNKEMVKFTEEKARYTNNLLKTYSFLNIVALGLLVYVYRSAQ